MAVLVSVGLATGYANGRRLVRLSDGTLYCIYNRSPNGAWQIYVKKSTDNGSTWTDETLLSTYAGMSTKTQAVPSIAVDASDNLHAVWHGFADGFAKYQIWYAKFNGSTWSEPVRISDKGGMTVDHQRYPSIAVDGSDNLHVVWGGKATGFSYAQIYYSKFVSSWSEPVRISDYAGMESYEQEQAGIAIDSNGYLHVAWQGKATGFTTANQVWYNKYDGSWAGPVRISTYTGMHSEGQGGPSIAVDSNDYIHVVWYGLALLVGNSAIWYNKYTDSWAGPVLISDYPGMSGRPQSYPSIAVDSTNAVHVVWHGKGDGYIVTDVLWYNKYVAAWAGPEVIQTPGEMSAPNLRWSRYPSSNIPANGVDYVFTEAGVNIYWDKKDFPFIAASTVATNQATAVEATIATPNGTLEDDGGEACDCGFEWGETEAYGNTTPTQSRTTGQTFAQTITGLDPNKTYHFRAFATNAVGTSHGADRSFTTLMAAPTVTTDPATGRGAIAATPNGTLDSDGGETCECGFEWGLDTGYGTTTPTQSKTTGETFSQVIGGLFPGTTYHFRAFATNSFGTGHGADRSFATALVISRGHALGREEL